MLIATRSSQDFACCSRAAAPGSPGAFWRRIAEQRAWVSIYPLWCRSAAFGLHGPPGILVSSDVGGYSVVSLASTRTDAIAVTEIQQNNINKKAGQV